MSLMAAQRSGHRDAVAAEIRDGSVRSGPGPKRTGDRLGSFGVGAETNRVGHHGDSGGGHGFGRAEASVMTGNSEVGSPKYNISSGALASTSMM